MTIKLSVILIVVVCTLYNLILDVVRYRSANNPTPENLNDVYDSETYEKWKKYSAENCKLSIASTLVTSSVVVIMLAFNLHSAFASLFPKDRFMQLLSVILLEAAVDAVVGTVFAYISTMKIEEKYGFNRSSIKTFIADRLRALALGIIIPLGIVPLLLGLHTAMGDWMILIFAVVLFVVMLLISFLYPIFSRIGNKFTPLEDGELKERLMELLTKHGYRVKAIEVMDASRRTTKLNAYFTGFGKLKTIVLYDNLVSSMDTDEICAVFAHELGHGLNKDVLKNQVLNFLNLFLMSLVVWFAVRTPELHTEFGFSEVNYGFAYLLTSLALGLLQPLTALVINANSRRAEYRADKQAVIEGYGDSLVAALKKLARENFSNLAPSRLNVVLEYSHPPMSERVAAVAREVEKLTK